MNGTSVMPLEFVNHRWLGNVPVCERAILIMDKIVNTFVEAAETKKISRPTYKSYEVVKEVIADKLLVPKLHYFKCIALQLQPFLATYQTDRPMVCFLSDDLCLAIRSLMRRFIKSDVLEEANDERLVKIDVSDKKIHVDHKKVDVGFSSAKAMKEAKVSDRQLLHFRMEAKTFLVELLKKMLHKCPISYSFVRHMSCFNPVKMATEKEICTEKLKKLLNLLLMAERVQEKDCDCIVQQYTLLLDNIPIIGKERFAGFNKVHQSVDELFYECMVGHTEHYGKLFEVVKILLTLSHGQAAVERGFSINKEVEVENLKQQNLVAQRRVCDHVKNAGSILNVELSKELLFSARMARQKYERYLEAEREKRKTEAERNKRKDVLDEIDELKKKKRRTESDMADLHSTADKLSEKAESTGKMTFVTQANSLRRTAKDKKDVIGKLERELTGKLEELKDM